MKRTDREAVGVFVGVDTERNRPAITDDGAEAVDSYKSQEAGPFLFEVRLGAVKSKLG